MEQDSLVYSWAAPLDSNINDTISNYESGYSYNSPLPGTTQNVNNIPGVVNPNTGEISFTSYTQGAFVTVIKVAVYKCGTLVSEVFREMQIVLLACGSNNPPDVTAPFIDPISGNYVVYSDTVYAGELVTFPLSATDFEFNPNGNPQTLYLTASGAQFGLGDTNATTGCLNPPCATLAPAPINQSTGPSPSIGGQFGVSTNFSWQTTSDHLSANTGGCSKKAVYNFVLKVQDDFCPVPSIKSTTITIVVLSPLTAAPFANNISICGSSSATLTASGAKTGMIYQWYDGAYSGSLLKSDTATIDGYISHYNTFVTAKDTFYVRLDSLGFESAIVPIIVTVNPLPDSSFTHSVSSSALTLTTLANPNASYYWDFGDGSTSNNANPQYTYATGGYYNVCLTVMDNTSNGYDRNLMLNYIPYLFTLLQN